MLVDRGTASAAEIVTGALQDRGRAKVVGTHTYGKGVFQEIQPLPNGGALDFTVGEYFTPNGRNLGGGGVSRGAGIKPNVYAFDTPAVAHRHRAARSPSRRSPPSCGERRRPRTASDSRVAVLARQGKFLVAEPFFGPGARVAVSRDKRFDVGDLVLLGRPDSGSRRQRAGADAGRRSSGGWGALTWPVT